MDANETLLSNMTMNGTMEENAVDPHARIKGIIVVSQYVMTIIGAIANLATLFILKEAGATFAPGYLLLLRNQAFLDFMVCTMGTFMMLQSPMWKTGKVAFDSFICHVWHGQFLYWIWVLSAIWNLIMVAYERFLAICHPFKHVDLTIGRIWRLIILAYSIGIISNLGCPVQVRMSAGTCVSEYAIPGKVGEWVFFVYGPYVWFINWLFPFILFCIFYGKVLITLFARRDNSNFGESRVINSATSQMTKTAIAVTIIFVLSMSWDIWYYMLGRLGLVSYIKNTLLQLIGLWLSAFNSVANPFVYIILLPAFRRATLKTLLPCMKNEPQGKPDTGRNGISKTDQSGNPRKDSNIA